MSFVIAAPEQLQGAAEDLAGIRASLTDAAAAVAGPTTGIAAAAQDEISTAVASMFGSFGAEFQAVHTQAQAFGERFASSLGVAAGAYASAESAASQALFTNTAANLQALQSAITANPAPLLRQFVSNQTGFGQTIAAALGTPLNLAIPADPAAVLQTIVDQQIGYGQTVSTALNNAALDFSANANALPATVQTAAQQLATGDVTGAARGVATGFGNLFLTGLVANQDMETMLINITPTGTIGDLLPILAIPGQMAQNFTDLLPAGSVPAQISQHLTNVITTLTDTSQTLDLVTGDLHVGLPLVLGLEAIGPVVTTVNAFGTSANAVLGALQTGNVLGAGAALLDAPATVLDGFLNGQATLPLSVTLGELTTTTNVPLGGILTPAQTASLTLEIFGTSGTIPLFGTAFGGILPGLLTFLPEQLAEAIGSGPGLLP
ncbi:PE family protein [Mycobacterium paragordonae]|uniref:PE family protein n=1 Tax=Mycobacterium paragordonae TaxID=1389713 RepID=UPI0010615D4D|nr:PE family protein [Mycobacterium paragordonae]TDK91057.1 PE family protein [Mycobacterium paragordonae]